LIDALEAAAGTGEPTENDVAPVRLEATDRVLRQVASEGIIRLQHFAFDADIRARDAAYDQQIRAELRWRAAELRDLIDGKDPHGRRKSTFKRMLQLFKRKP
jgi:hypothetical protein